MAVAVVNFHDGGDGRSGTVVLQSNLKGPNAITELKSSEARNAAIREASSRGIPAPGTGMGHEPYPVDETGEVVGRSDQKTAAYRTDIPVASRY